MPKKPSRPHDPDDVAARSAARAAQLEPAIRDYLDSGRSCSRTAFRNGVRVTLLRAALRERGLLRRRGRPSKVVRDVVA